MKRVAYLRIVQHVELLCRIPARIQENGLLASRMVGQEFRDVKDLAINDDPDVVLLVVLGNLGSSERSTA